MRELLPCPFCGGEVSIALCGDGFDAWWFITRGHGENACKCRLFMESEKFNKDSEMADFVADDLIAAWNSRTGNDTNVATNNAVPVVRGEWNPIFKGADTCKCSVCKRKGVSDSDYGFIATPYCPNCGAKMESEGST